MRRVASLLALITLLCAPSAAAQSWDVSAMTGYALPAELDQATRGVDSTSVGGGFSWQLAIGRNFGSRFGAEAFWMEQFTSYRVEAGGETGTLFKMSMIQLHGNFLYHLGGAGSRVQPYALVGVGSTFFSATDLEKETKFSMGVGGGVKMFIRDEIGLRGQFRYKPTFLNDSQSDFCDPFGFCQSTLNQFEFSGGVTFRF